MAGEFGERTRARIADRADGICEKCLTAPGEQFHHRRARGMGGTKRIETAAVENGVFICAECHAWIESNRTAALGLGWLVRSRQMPAEVPVLIGGRRVYLTAEGDYNDVSEVQ